MRGDNEIDGKPRSGSGRRHSPLTGARDQSHSVAQDDEKPKPLGGGGGEGGWRGKGKETQGLPGREEDEQIQWLSKWG